MRLWKSGALGALWAVVAITGCAEDPVIEVPPAPDLAAFAQPPDLATPPDLAAPRDLTVPPDLAMPPDLAVPSIAPGAVVLNEIHAANTTGLVDEDKDSSDWIELYNPTAAPVDLTGAGLTDTPGKPYQWMFPPGAAIGPGRHLLVFASGKNRAVWGRPLHTNFVLKNGEGRVALTAPGNRELDALVLQRSKPDITWCRMPNGTGPFALCLQPTPNAVNQGLSYPSMLSPPSVSVPGGFYATDQMVELSTVEPGAEIRYTLDGSEPVANSPLYSGPVPITSRAADKNRYAGIDTTPPNTYITFYAPKDNEVYKSTVLRAATFANGKLASPINTHTYFIDPNAANLYSGATVISLGIDPPQLFNQTANPRGIMVSGPNSMGDNGPYCMSCNWWLDRRVQGSIELFRPDRSVAFRADAGFKVSGNWSRTYPQKTLDVAFKDVYGPRSVTEPLFRNRPYTKFKTFRLRNGGTDWLRAMMRDSLVQSFARDMPSVHYGEHERAVVFLDGEYWGQMELREHTKEDYLEQRFGVDANAVDVVDVSCFGQSCDTAQAQAGNMLAWNAWWGYLTTHKADIAASYDLVKKLVDPENLASYLAYEVIAYNTDWPGNNNRWWREQGPDHPWHFLLQDLDLTFNTPYRPGPPTANNFGTMLGNNKVGTLATTMLANPQFKTLFINVLADMFNTSFSQATMNARLQAFVAEMTPLMPEFYARWRPQNNTVMSWMNEQMVIQDFINRREAAFIPIIQSQFGLGNKARYILTVNVNDVAMGRVKINTIDLGLGGRLVDVNKPWTGKYFPGVPITAVAIPAPGYKFVQWQGASQSNQAEVTLNLMTDSMLTAVFDVDPMWKPANPPPPPPPPPGGLVNVALGAGATQSSVSAGHHAGLAVDGDWSGAAADNSVALTNTEANPWWQVDLGQEFDIYRIDLFNRIDSKLEQFADFRVFVSTSDMTGRTYQSLATDNSIWQVAQVGPAYLDFSRLVGVKGRYVRVQVSGMGTLPLAEVQVMAVPPVTLVPDQSLLRNLALGKNAGASSDGGGAPGLAVDGNPDPAAMARTTALTRVENAPWWEVDLGGSHVLSSVQLYSGSRLTNFVVFISKQPMAGKTLADLASDASVWKYEVTQPIGAFVRIPSETAGRYVRVQMKDANVALPLAEVVVMGLVTPAP